MLFVFFGKLTSAATRAEARKLFAYAEIEDEARWQAIAQTPECQKWWRHMGQIMPANPDHSPKSSPLGEVFHLD